MTARLLMNTKPTVLKQSDSIGKAVRMIMEHRYRNIPVVDDVGRYLGVFGVHCMVRMILPRAVTMDRGLSSIPFVTETLVDLRRRLHDIEDLPVMIGMTHDAPVVAPDTELLETLMTLNRTRTSIPVVEPATGRLVGVISYFDVGDKVLAKEP